MIIQCTCTSRSVTAYCGECVQEVIVRDYYYYYICINKKGKKKKLDMTETNEKYKFTLSILVFWGGEGDEGGDGSLLIEKQE